jgi:hypothetical protein
MERRTFESLILVTIYLSILGCATGSYTDEQQERQQAVNLIASYNCNRLAALAGDIRNDLTVEQNTPLPKSDSKTVFGAMGDNFAASHKRDRISSYKFLRSAVNNAQARKGC